MRVEPGGRASKYGNEYENRYLARLLLRVVNEEATSVTVEPLGEFSDSIEYCSTAEDGSVDYYQCKVSNGAQKSWTVASLQKYDVFSRAKKILTSEPRARYHFISPLTYNELDALCIRARTTASPDEFINFSLTNKDIRSAYESCSRAFDANNDNAGLKNLLSRCEFEQVPFTESATQDLNERIGLILTGNAESARVLLENYANSFNRYGVRITAKELQDYLGESGHYLRGAVHDHRAMQRIEVLNRDYWDKCPGIDGKMLNRDAAKQAIQEIEDGYSIILHGRAGAGKSGCLQEIVETLKERNTLYLSVKLDKFIPEDSADKFGKTLGLPQSPVYTLANLAAGNLCVLLLDQLDALRWTSKHSSTALQVCKEMMSQAAAVNNYQGGKVSIVFAARTFDLENDPGLQKLFESNGEENSTTLNSRRILVDVFSEEEAVQVIGPSYHDFSPRLKKLLRTPSSLYVWAKLSPDKRSDRIVSVREMMSKWWDQIQFSCETAGISRSDAVKCRDRIITYMERNSVFVLSRRLFSDYTHIIDLFISNGMLRENIDSISFVHQSFLDYFVTLNILDGIYTGKDVTALIESYDNQVPNVRYRLLAVLRELIDSTPKMFVRQARIMLQSDSVHDYFKCGVFEVIGQCEEPSEDVFALLDDYLALPKWQSYVVQTVYYRHPVYIKRLARKEHNWLEGEKLSMLRSIADMDSAFVAEILRPYAKKSAESDKKIYQTLSYDIAGEEEASYCLRMELLNNNPEFLNAFWGLHDLIGRKSGRAVDLLAFILSVYPQNQYNQVYLEDQPKLVEYAEENCTLVVGKLFPLIAEKTKDYLPTWPSSYHTDYDDWIMQPYQNTTVRTIVTLVKNALRELARNHEHEFKSIVDTLNYPVSGIVHEMIITAMSELPEEDSDYCISWLLSSFHTKVFVFSGNQLDYLECTNIIIKKFSPHCSLELFQKLERAICSWQDNKEHILWVLKCRLDAVRKGGLCERYTYWGHFQKSVLPNMDYSRLSKSARELIGVLNRNNWICIPYYHSGLLVGEAKSVVSPLDSRAELLSDRKWIQIITTPASKMKDRFSGSDSGPYYVEASHPMFASALGKQARKELVRFAELSLQFPEGCYQGYIAQILCALSDAEAQEIPADLLFRVIRRYQNFDSNEISIAILRVVRRYAKIEWPEDILSLVANCATCHANPEPDEYVVSSGSDPKHKSIDTLISSAINCVRGCALEAIGAILWHHQDLGVRFRKTVEKACNDNNDSVRCAVMFCVLPYYNIDSSFSERLYKALIARDIRIFAAPRSSEILSRTFASNRGWYLKKLDEALDYDAEDLANYIAGLYCGLLIFVGDMEKLRQFSSRSFTEKQKDEICKEAIHMFSNIAFHDKSEFILRCMISASSAELHYLGSLFHHNYISIERDMEFLVFLMGSCQGAELLHSFLHYLKESDSDICGYAPVFQSIGNSIPTWQDKRQRTYWMIDDFAECVVRLFDNGKDDPDIRAICLNIWDKLFMSNLQGLKPIAAVIEESETILE